MTAVHLKLQSDLRISCNFHQRFTHKLQFPSTKYLVLAYCVSIALILNEKLSLTTGYKQVQADIGTLGYVLDALVSQVNIPLKLSDQNGLSRLGK